MRPQVITLAQPVQRRRTGAVITLVLVLLVILAATRAVHTTSAAPDPAHFSLNLDGNLYHCTMKGKTLDCAYVQR